MYRNALQRHHQAELIGLNDDNNNPIREGDILYAASGFRYIVIWNEFINDFIMLFVSCFRDMVVHPYTRETYMENCNPMSPLFVDFWHLRVMDNIDNNPAVLNDSSLS
jgi:hypothetical protein